MTTEHTPIPWELGHDEGDGRPVVTYQARDICWVETTFGDGEANAAFILRAVNCHDELLAACEGLLDAFPPPPIRSCNGWAGNMAHSIARTAIAKAKGLLPADA